MAVRRRPVPMVPPLARWPLHRAAAQQMHVQMKHRLPRPWSDIQDRAITIFYTALPRHFGRGQVATSDNLRVLGRCFLKSGDVFLRHYQQMCRRLWIDFFEGKS